eukprot:3504495-Pleurochrysis_carterae.AAC.1
MDAVRTLYPDLHARRKGWHAFFDRFPLSVRKIPADDIDPVKRAAVPPCSLRLPKDAALSNHWGRFAESITYHNPVSGTCMDTNKIRLAAAAAADIPILQVGNIICVLPDEEYLKANGADFWLAKNGVNEAVDTGDTHQQYK